MARFSQKERVISVKTPLGEDVLLLEGFTGRETISRPFRFQLQLLSEDPDIDPASLLRESVVVTVRLPDDSERHIHGKVSRFRQVGGGAVLHAYQAEVVPWLWFLSLSNDCRIFQNKSVPEIVDEIFSDYPDADFSNKCMGSYPPREYCVQYRESDLDFVTRLLAEEGIFYFFEHTNSGHRMILADDPNSIPKCAQKEVRVTTDPDKPSAGDLITVFEREMAVHSTSVTLTDYDDLQPSLNLLSSASDGSFEEVYDYPGKFTDTSQGERYAGLRLEALSAGKERIRGESRVRAFESGHQFELVGYPAKGLNKAYLLLAIEHKATDGSYRAPDAGEGTDYRNRFQCIPAAVPFRPRRRRAKPRVLGSQTAVVVGPSGEEIYTDEHSRVKVQFHWDREGKKDENSSCWVRVSQPWAGKSWGAIAIPRIGQEVIVDFLEGDPDRPIITGRVYNATQIPPYGLPANKTQTGLKSRSSKSGDGATFNEIRMEDKKGEELLSLHAEKDKSVVVENDNTESVGHDESTSVENDQTVSVGNDQSLTVGNNQTISVGAKRSETVGSDHEESIGSNMALSVGESRTVSVGKSLSEEVGEAATRNVGKSMSETVGEKLTIQVGKDQAITVGGKRSLSVAKDSSHAAKKIQLNADDEISIVTGQASITMKKNGDITIKGKKITVKGSGDVVLKGSKIAQN
jgi:type VI secretion system secreted protein VgrG